MLDLIPTSWFSAVSAISLTAYTEDGTYRPFRVLIAELPVDKRPYRFGNKPEPSSKNYLGNRDVNHLQLHGSLLWGPDVGVDKTGVYPGLYSGHGANITFDAAVVNKLHSSARQDHVRVYPKDKHEHVINYVEYYGRGWFWFELELSLDFYWTPTLGSGKRNYRCSFRQATFYKSGTPRGVTRYVRPRYVWDAYIDEIDIETCFRTARAQCLAYVQSTPWKLDTSGNGYSQAYYFPVGNPKFGFRSSFLSSIKRDIFSYAARCEPDNPVTEADLGAATRDAAARVRYFDGNTAVYLKELLELKDSILSLVSLLKGKVNLKSLADLYVSNKYGLRLTALDTIDLYEAIRRKAKEQPTDAALFSVSRGSGTYSHCKLYYDPLTRNGLATVSANLMEWDLFPSLTNVWDIVPYSLVVDWFIDVEGFLDAIDTRTYLSVLNVFSCLYSYKYEWGVVLPRSLPFFGRLSASRFRRFTLSKPIEPTPTFSGSLPTVDNIITGGALIIQRR